MVVTALPRVPGTTYDDDELTPTSPGCGAGPSPASTRSGMSTATPSPTTSWSTATVTATGRRSSTSTTPARRPRGRHRLRSPGVDAARRAPDLSHVIPSAFLDGYAEVRALDLAVLPDAARAVARRTLASYDGPRRRPADPDWPDWALRLHATVTERARGTPVCPGLRPRLRWCGMDHSREPDHTHATTSPRSASGSRGSAAAACSPAPPAASRSSPPAAPPGPPTRPGRARCGRPRLSNRDSQVVRAIRPARAMDDLSVLSETIGPRIGGTESEYRAADYAARRLERAGCQVWLEPFPVADKFLADIGDPGDQLARRHLLAGRGVAGRRPRRVRRRARRRRRLGDRSRVARRTRRPSPVPW